MSLTSQQASTLKTAILADPTLVLFKRDPDGASSVAMAINSLATPSFTVWKTSVTVREIGTAILSTDLSALTATAMNSLSLLIQLSGGVFNPSNSDVRTAFANIFVSGSTTKAAIIAVAKRFATVGEKIFATGTGSDASPANLTFEGTITYQDVLTALAS